MFNRKQKRIEELEKELAAKVRNINELNELIDARDREIHELYQSIDSITALKDKTPEDCVPGSYCKSCEFAKVYHQRNTFHTKTYYVCSKGNSCSQFIQKEGDR